MGVGQPFRQDDAVGRMLAQQLRDDPWPGIRVIESNGDGMAMIDTWQNAHTVWVVDAVAPAKKPGTIYRFEAHQEELPQTLFGNSTHHWSLGEAIEMSRVLGHMPQRLIVFGIEGNSFNHGQELTPEVEEAMPIVMERIQAEYLEQRRLAEETDHA